MRDIEIAHVHGCIDKSLDLLDRTYSSAGPGMGGWYHRLDLPTPGPSATAVALHAYLLANRLPTRLTEGLAFLRSRQVTSTKALLDGGWPVNVSAGRPVLEATSVVVRLLGFSHLMLGRSAPDATRGYQWIVNNQNSDGGWGSFLEQPSRVWLTAMAVRALVEMNPNAEAILPAVEWLLRARDPETNAWGERSQEPATVTHTAFVLTCLVDSRAGGRYAYVDDAVKKGFDWLQAHVDTSKLYDDSARIESYNISYTDADKQVIWQNAVWHPSLPYLLSALMRHPSGADPSLIGTAVEKILDAQSADGRWPNADGSAGISMWSVWPFVDALCEFVLKSPVRRVDTVTLLSSSSILIRRGRDTSTSLSRLLWRYGLAGGVSFLKRYWAIVFFIIVLLAGSGLTIARVLNISEFVLALVFPVVLVGIQELMARSRSS